MKSFRRSLAGSVVCRATLVAMWLVVPVDEAVGQPLVRPGESRANQIQYFSSHNSYQRSYSIKEQLDRLNVWEVELDVKWADNANCLGGPADFFVAHFCGDAVGADWLNNYLVEQIAFTERIATGFFFLNIEDDDGYLCLGCRTGPTFPSEYRRRLENSITTWIPSSSIYTWADFVTDQHQWPSVQELIRRGKHVAISLGDDTPTDESFFFARNSGLSKAQPVVIWNNSNIDASKDEPAGDRYLKRRYLPESASPSCELEALNDPGGVLGAIQAGFNFPATNCLDIWGDLSNFQPPLPLYVSRAAAPSASGRGTYLDPVVGPSAGAAFKRGVSLVDNFEAATGKKSLIEMRIPAGDYDLTGGGGSYVIGAAVRLENSNPQAGPVTLR